MKQIELKKIFVFNQSINNNTMTITLEKTNLDDSQTNSNLPICNFKVDKFVFSKVAHVISNVISQLINVSEQFEVSIINDKELTNFSIINELVKLYSHSRYDMIYNKLHVMEINEYGFLTFTEESSLMTEEELEEIINLKNVFILEYYYF